MTMHQSSKMIATSQPLLRLTILQPLSSSLSVNHALNACNSVHTTAGDSL